MIIKVLVTSLDIGFTLVDIKQDYKKKIFSHWRLQPVY